MAGLSTQQASNLANDQQKATAQTIADLLAQGDALKGDAQGRVNGGSQGYYEGGTGGYTVDNSPQVNAQATQIANEVANIFGQAQDTIKGQAPAIQQATQGRQNLLTSDRVSSGWAAQSQQNNQLADQQRAIAAMGLSGLAGAVTGRANRVADALTNYRDSFGKLQTDYFGQQGQIDLERNAAQADSFRNANEEQQKAIEAARQAALAKAIYWVPGSRGRYVSTYGTAGKKADRSLISSITKEQKSITKAQAAEQKQRDTNPTIRQSQVQANRRLT